MKQLNERCILFDFPTKEECVAFLKGIEFCNPGLMILLREENAEDKTLIEALEKADLIAVPVEPIIDWDFPDFD